MGKNYSYRNSYKYKQKSLPNNEPHYLVRQNGKIDVEVDAESVTIVALIDPQREWRPEGELMETFQLVQIEF